MARCVCVWGHIQTKTKTLTHTHVLVHCTNPPRALVCLQHSRHTRPLLLFLFSFFFFLSFFLKHLTSYALSFFISRSLCLCVFVLISSKFYDSFHLYYFFFFFIKKGCQGPFSCGTVCGFWLVDFLAFGFFFISRYQLFNIVSFCFLICGFCYI